jgi:hypothetical protein
VKTEKVLVSSLALIFLISFTAWAQDQPQQSQPPQKDPLQRIIELVVENNPTLQSQESLIREIQQMPEPGAGFIDLKSLEAGSEIEAAGIRTPLLSMSQLEEIRDKMLQRRETLEKARQTYEALKKSLVTELFTGLTDLSRLKNKKKSLSQLESFLRNRAESLSQQVKAGLEKPTTLFDLTERVMSTSMEIGNATEELKTLKLRIAITMGGDKWQELSNLLDKLK